MHSRIYQISEKPILEENLINEGKYLENGFIGRIADYVAHEEDEADIKSSLDWLNLANSGIETDSRNKTIKITSKKAYFEEKYENFQEYLKKLQNTTFEEFIGNKEIFEVYHLKGTYNDEYGFYIDDSLTDENYGLSTLDYWVRHAEENKIYYVGNVFDYHF